MSQKLTNRTLIPAVLIVFTVFAALSLMAGPNGTIKGTVTDQATGDPVMGASVTIVNTTLGTTTAPDGKFTLTNIPAGRHTIKVTALGYVTVNIADVEVTAGKTTEQNIVLTRAVTDLDKTIKVTAKSKGIDKYVISSQVTVSNEVGNVCAPSMRMPSPGEYRPGSPAHGGTAIVNGEPFDAMFFERYGTNPFVDTEDDHLSTFAIDTDDASYIMARSYLERGELPPKDAVRTEEFINHFDYGYTAPDKTAFEVYMEGAPSKFGQNCDLLKIGIKGLKIEIENRKAANLVFVIDVSGSMNIESRLGLVKKALRLLVNELNNNDKVGIVVYGSRGQVILEPTSIENKDDILTAIEFLHPNGSTNAEEGLRLGYAMAEKMYESGKINRIILCSDGVANVGTTKAEDILDWIKGYADKGITLSAIGFGMGNYNDILMEKLGDKGNGHYAYVDDIGEARRIFVENLTGTLQVIARDVKIQVDFDPEVVRSYRLLGYENRDVADNKFRDDKEDGGEIGSGHEVTALYEIKYHKDVEPETLGTVFIRYKDPDNGEVTEINRAIDTKVFADNFDRTSSQFRLAAVAAEFAEILRKSYWAKDSKLADVMTAAKDVFNENDSSEFLELMNLISSAEKMEDKLAKR